MVPPKNLARKELMCIKKWMNALYRQIYYNYGLLPQSLYVKDKQDLY